MKTIRPPWTITPNKIKAAIQKIISIEQPCKVILFGSTVQGKPDIHSDIDIMVVVKDEHVNPRKESIRIRRALQGINMAMDIIVVSENFLQKVADQPGLIYREVLRSGKVVYESAK